MAADPTFESYRKPTRRDEFLKTMQAIVPWSALCEVIEPHYPKAGNGRPPIGLQRMLRIHFIQHWFNLADLSCEEAQYDSASLRRFVGIDLGCEPVPDATTLTKFRKPSGYGALARWAIAGWRRMRHGRSRPWRWPTFTSVAKDCWHRCAHNAPRRATGPEKRPQGAIKQALFTSNSSRVRHSLQSSHGLSYLFSIAL